MTTVSAPRDVRLHAGEGPEVDHDALAGLDTESRDALLELGTQLVNGSWAVVVAPDAGEASAVFLGGPRTPYPDDEYEETSWWMMLPQEERDRRNRVRAARRASKKLRQYAVQNFLSELYTLTYRCVGCQGDPCTCGEVAGPASRAIVKRHVADFIRALRRHLPDDFGAFPYGYVIERGTRSTRRLHVHLLLPSGFPRDLPPALWQHGRTDYSPPKRGKGARSQARRAAGYLAKYLAKSLGDEDPAWAHSYERAEGFNVRQVRRRLTDVHDVLWFIEHYLGRSVALSLSSDWNEYEGPPAFVARQEWDDEAPVPEKPPEHGGWDIAV